MITHKSCRMPSVPAKTALPRHWSRTRCAGRPSPASGRGEKTAADQPRQRHPAKLVGNDQPARGEGSVYGLAAPSAEGLVGVQAMALARCFYALAPRL